MKKILLYLSAFALSVTGLTSCADDYEEYDNSWLLDNDETMVLEASSASIELDESLLDEPALTFTWTPAREMSDEYILTYVTMLDLKVNQFSSSTVIREVVDDDVFSMTYTTEDLQNYIVDKWVQSVSEVTTLSFKVIAKWEGGSKYVMPEVRTVDVDVLPYRPNVFEADRVNLDGDAVRGIMPSMNYTMSTTPENEYVYAGEFKMAAGKMTIPVLQDGATLYICPADGETVDVPDADLVDGKPAPTEAYKAKVLDLPDSGDPDELPAWNLPVEGDWRVIIDMENETVQFYSPKNKLEPAVIRFNYAYSSDRVLSREILPGEYYLYLNNGTDGWKANYPLQFEASLIDPQILVWGDGTTLSIPTSGCSVKVGRLLEHFVYEDKGSTGDDPEKDSEVNFTSRVAAFSPGREADVPLQMNTWMTMSTDVSNKRWQPESTVNIKKITIDIRNSKIRFD